MSEVQATQVASVIHDAYHSPALSSGHVDNDTTGSPASRSWQLTAWCAGSGIFLGHPLSLLFGRPLDEHVLPSWATSRSQAPAGPSTLEQSPTSPFPSSQTVHRTSFAPKSGASSVAPGTAQKRTYHPNVFRPGISQTTSNMQTPNPVTNNSAAHHFPRGYFSRPPAPGPQLSSQGPTPHRGFCQRTPPHPAKESATATLR